MPTPSNTGIPVLCSREGGATDAVCDGVNGIVIIAHGSSTHTGIKNAILGARREFELGLNEHIRKGIDALRAAESAMAPVETSP